ncbi:hypothetical protein ACLFMI_19495 [Pseudonocardia nantongensis]
MVLDRFTNRNSNRRPVTGVHLYVHHSSSARERRPTVNQTDTPAETVDTTYDGDDETHIVRGLD